MFFNSLSRAVQPKNALKTAGQDKTHWLWLKATFMYFINPSHWLKDWLIVSWSSFTEIDCSNPENLCANLS